MRTTKSFCLTFGILFQGENSLKMKEQNIGNNKYSGLVKNTFIFGIGLVGSKFVQFILLPYFTNVLTTAEYGTIDLVVTFVGLMVPLVTLELSDSVLRFGLSNDTNKKALVVNAGLVLAISAILTVMLSPLIVFYESIAEFRWYIVLLIITQAFRTNLALFVKADNRVTAYSVDSILTAAIIASCDIVFISKFNMSIRGYFFAEIIGNCCSTVFLIFIGRIKKYISLRYGIDLTLMKHMIKYSIPLMFNALSWWITTFSDRMILDLYFTTSEVGIYSVAAKIPAIVTTLLSVFTQAWIMSAVKEYENGKDVKFFENVYSIYSAFLFSFVSITIIIIKPVMRLYVGKAFFDAWYYVPLLLSGTVFLGISNYYGAIYASAKANLLEIKSTMICAASNIVLNFLLIPRLNILGAVIATACSYVIVVIVRIIDTRKILIMQNPATEIFLQGFILLCEIYFIMRDAMVLAVMLGLCMIILNLVTLKKHGYIDAIKQQIKR